MSTQVDREKAIEAAMTQIERQFGKGSIMKLGSRAVLDVPVIPTGSLALDKALGIGGLPRGRVCEIFGPEPEAMIHRFATPRIPLNSLRSFG